MAVSNELILNPGDKVRLMTDSVGDGAIAGTDPQVTNITKYPLGSRYFDKTAKKEYRRIAEAGVIGDWVSGAAMT